MKKLISGLMAAIFGLALVAAPVGAQGDDLSAHGNVDYTAYNLQRHAQFEVEPNSNKCLAWNVNGSYTFNFMLTGDPTVYTHDATISNENAAGNYNISGGYPAGGPYQFAWAGTGHLSGNTVTNSIDYSAGAPGTHMDMTGTVAPDGTMSGTWSDNYNGGNRTGTWSTASGAATQVFGCKGDGKFRYSDANHDSYVVDVKYVKIKGADAWFAGKVTKASNSSWVGNWLFAKVHDGGKNGDLIWGSFTSESAAKMGVASMSDPADGPFAVTNGNIKVGDE